MNKKERVIAIIDSIIKKQAELNTETSKEVIKKLNAVKGELKGEIKNVK